MTPLSIDWIQAFGWFGMICGMFASAMLVSLVLDVLFRRFEGDGNKTATKTPGLRVSRKERAILEATGRSGVFVGHLPVVNTLCDNGLLRPLSKDTFELTEHGAWVLKQISEV